MKKIPTLFKRNPADMRRVLPEVTPGCEWVLAGEGAPTRKYDGTCVAYFGPTLGWWARREVKPSKRPPENFRPEETDENTGKTVGWEPIEQSPFAKFHAEALAGGLRLGPPQRFERGTYELVGPKINGNPEGHDTHELIPHAFAEHVHAPFRPHAGPVAAFEDLREVLTSEMFYGVEGVVWHHPDGRMAKLKVRDFA